MTEENRPHPSMLPLKSSEERLSLDELHEATDLLSEYRTCVGDVPDVTTALLKTLLIRRDGAARAILTHLRWCLAYEESA